MTEGRPIHVSNELEVKRKQCTSEKAKAKYLCSQLRIRLQYAKLKVDHGWQKQSLSEVENLYFQHSQTNKKPKKASYGGSKSVQHSNTLLQSGPSSVPLGNTKATSAHLAPHRPIDLGLSLDGLLAILSGDSSSSANILSTPSGSSIPPRQPPRHTASIKGKERGSFPAILLYGTPATPAPRVTKQHMGYYSPAPANDFPPATLSDSSQSSARYLSNTYISSSPFPINVPTPSEEPPLISNAENNEPAMTYDSFWSSHASWSSQTPATYLSVGSPTRVSSTCAAPTSTQGL